MITREQALKLLHDNMESPNLRRHCYAVEAVMRALARYFSKGENSADAKAMADKWGVVGLLHDGDYEKTKETPEKHTLLMVEWLKEAGENDPEIISAILSHNFAHLVDVNVGDGVAEAPKNNLEWSLYCCDELTGLIVAVALVKPDKTLASVTVDSVMKKWKEKSFAAGVKREQIEKCEEELNIPLREFVQIALEAMQGISIELGL
jgi:hypothetical protein